MTGPATLTTWRQLQDHFRGELERSAALREKAAGAVGLSLSGTMKAVGLARLFQKAGAEEREWNAR